MQAGAAFFGEHDQAVDQPIEAGIGDQFGRFSKIVGQRQIRGFGIVEQVACSI